MKGVKNNMAKKKYSAKQKADYHQKRLRSSVSDNKKAYSRNWLEGFKDSHAVNNLGPTKSELADRLDYIKHNKSNMSKSELASIKRNNNIVFRAYINGAKTRVDNKLNDFSVRELLKGKS